MSADGTQLPPRLYEAGGNQRDVLVFMGGALGGLCGGAAAGINVKIFNSARSAKFKYAVSLLVSLGGVAAYLLAAVVLVLVFPSLGKR
jgi:hypothetical protein